MGQTYKKIFLLIAVVLQSCASIPEQTSTRRELSSGDYTIEAVAKRLEATIRPQIGSGKNVGAIIGIFDRGEIKYLSFGETKKGNGKAPHENTVFEIGSLTKPFTGLMLANAIEKGWVQETDRLDSFNTKWRGQKSGSITLVELATHRSGLPRLPCNLKILDPKRPYAHYSESDLITGLMAPG